MIAWLVLTALSAQRADCPVQLEASVLDGSTLSAAEFRQALSAELAREVVLEGAPQCDQVAIVVDVGVVTLTVRARGSHEQKRLLTRTGNTQVVRESVLLAAGLLRAQLEAHLRGLPAVAAPAPSLPPVEETKPAAVPAWWVNGSGALGLTAMGLLLSGLELQGQRRFGLVRAGLAVSYSMGIETNKPSSRFQLFPEAGIYGGPGPLRLGLFVGAGPLFMREPSVGDSDNFQVLFAFRPRVVIAVAVASELDVQLGCGFTLALDASNLPRGLLYGSVGAGYGF
ncbi:MAG: hypothetical protein K1X64_02195 [Myxococcaceae bacterium]|nr:hypothetical protein [Myxococcaceae bacterium]